MLDEGPADLGALRQHLLECAEQYLSADLASQRRGVQNALFAVAKYLEKSDFPAITLLPVIRPALALSEREEHNAIDQMFAERARSGRPSTTIDAHLRTAILAALANVWLRIHQDDDRPQRTKLTEAARNMRGPWFEGVTGATLRTSREIVAREAKGHEVVEYFERFSRLINEVADTIGLSRSFPVMVRYINEHPVSRTMGILKTTRVSTLRQE
jgi:hypothetical protein